MCTYSLHCSMHDCSLHVQDMYWASCCQMGTHSHSKRSQLRMLSKYYASCWVWWESMIQVGTRPTILGGVTPRTSNLLASGINGLCFGTCLIASLIGSPLHVILEAGQWSSPAFLKYIDINKLDEGLVLHAHCDESSDSD